MDGEEGGGFDDAVDGDIELSAECVDGVGACGIACDDECFNAAVGQFFCAGDGISNDGLRRSVSVRDARGIAEVEIVLAGQGFANGIEHGQTAHTAIKYANRQMIV